MYIFRCEQFGFFKGTSTEDAINKVTEIAQIVLPNVVYCYSLTYRGLLIICGGQA